MEKRRKYHVIIGSCNFFDKVVASFLAEHDVDCFIDLVKHSDECKRNGSTFYGETSFLILKNNNYHCCVETAHDRLGSLIEELTEEDAEIYVHNPPRILMEFLNGQKELGNIAMELCNEEYDIDRNTTQFVEKINAVSKNIIGQEKAVEEVSKSLWYLTNSKRQRPYVVMLYGNSSLGKTELVREVAQNFFEGKFLEKHLSMFKNNNYADYFFGDAPNRISIGFDLLERESNLIFFDELDKCPDYFYSAFYTLFDNTLFKDATYDVNISGTLFLLTTNFNSEDEIKKNLGLPLFYRIDKFIHFEDFSTEVINKIAWKEIHSRMNELPSDITSEMIYKKVSPFINASSENARTIKYKVQQVIENIMYEDIKRDFTNE